jgi:uncharacterized protein YciI
LYFLITCKDRPGVLDQRLALRPEHLAYWQGLGEAVKLGGPRLAEDQPCGSFFLVEAADLDAARAIAEGDPFARDGIFAQIEVTATRLTLGGWQPTD